MTQDARGQLPRFYNAIIGLEQAQIDIWDQDFDAALANIDAANAMLGQSILQTLLDSVAVTEIFVNTARLYLEAGATDKARDQLEAVLRIYPANAYAKYILAEVLMAEGDIGNARMFLEDAVALWSDADDDFLYLQQARATLTSLET